MKQSQKPDRPSIHFNFFSQYFLTKNIFEANNLLKLITELDRTLIFVLPDQTDIQDGWR